MKQTPGTFDQQKHEKDGIRLLPQSVSNRVGDTKLKYKIFLNHVTHFGFLRRQFSLKAYSAVWSGQVWTILKVSNAVKQQCFIIDTKTTSPGKKDNKIRNGNPIQLNNLNRKKASQVALTMI